MLFKKVFFFLFFISSISIPGYYFYQRSNQYKEEEVQEEEPIQEEKEEAPLVEINGWLDCLLLNTIFYFSIFYLFLTLFMARLNMMVTNEVNKATNEQLKTFFVDYMSKKGITKKNIAKKIQEKEKSYDQISQAPNVQSYQLGRLESRIVELNMIKYCLDNDKFYISTVDFLDQFFLDKFKFPIIFFINSFIILQIILRYDLYFLMKSFWQVGFSKTFENLHWLDLFSIEKVFRRNSIIQKNVSLNLFILTTGFTFAWAFFQEYRPKALVFRSEVRIKLENKIADRKFASCLPLEVEEQIKDKVSKIKPQQNKKNL